MVRLSYWRSLSYGALLYSTNTRRQRPPEGTTVRGGALPVPAARGRQRASRCVVVLYQYPPPEAAVGAPPSGHPTPRQWE